MIVHTVRDGVKLSSTCTYFKIDNYKFNENKKLPSQRQRLSAKKSGTSIDVFIWKKEGNTVGTHFNILCLNHQMFDAALLTSCYTQHALRRFIGPETTLIECSNRSPKHSDINHLTLTILIS